MKFTVKRKGYAPEEVDLHIAKLTSEYEDVISKQRARIKEMIEANKKIEAELESYREKSNQISKAIVGAVAKAEEIERLSRIKYNQEISRLKAFHEKWTKYYDKILEEYPLDDRLAAAGEFNRRMDKILTRVGKDDEFAATFSEAEHEPEKHEKRTAAFADNDGVRIGYINVKADAEAEDADLSDLLPGADPESPIITGNFDPMERLGKYFAAEKEKQAQAQRIAVKTDEHVAATKTSESQDYADRSSSGFSFEEALNPTEDLESILKDLGI